MGRHISQKWYEFTTGDREIDRYGWVFDWWSKMSIAVIEIIDWWLKMSITMVEIIDCWFRIMVAMIQKTIEYQDWRLLWLKKRLVSENDYTEIDDAARLLLWSRMERPGNRQGIVHVF